VGQGRGDRARIGITAFAQEQSATWSSSSAQGGREGDRHEDFGVGSRQGGLRSLQRGPGEVVEINAELPKKPELVNTDPMARDDARHPHGQSQGGTA